MGDFLFFGTKKYFCVKNIEKYRKIYRKNIENYAFRAVKNIFIYYKNILDVQLVIRSVAAPQMTGNLSTIHQKGTGQVMI